MPYCPICKKDVNSGVNYCPTCGHRLIYLATESVCNTASPPSKLELKSPGRAAILSFFVFGLGQIYVGETRKGIIYLVLGILVSAVAYVSLMADYAKFGIFMIFVLIMLWISNVRGAYEVAERRNDIISAMKAGSNGV